MKIETILFIKTLMAIALLVARSMKQLHGLLAKLLKEMYNTHS